MDFEEAVLLAIANGLRTPKDIAKKLNVKLEDVKVALANLEARGFVERKVRGLLFKKEVYELTKEGFERAMKAKEKLMRVADEIKEAYERGDTARVEEIVAGYSYLIPLMLMFGLLDLVWLSDFYAINAYDIDSDADVDDDFDFDSDSDFDGMDFECDF